MGRVPWAGYMSEINSKKKLMYFVELDQYGVRGDFKNSSKKKKRFECEAHAISDQVRISGI